MAITRSNVERMGGTVEVESELGRGTCFTVRVPFPYSEAPGGEATAGHAIRRCRSFKGMRLLLAEDNAINREIAEMMLADAGFEVDAAENSQEAVDRVAGGGIESRPLRRRAHGRPDARHERLRRNQGHTDPCRSGPRLHPRRRHDRQRHAGGLGIY